VNETLPGTNTPLFTTFMDPPEVTDFDKAVVDNSVTVDLLNKAHLPGIEQSMNHWIFYDAGQMRLI